MLSQQQISPDDALRYLAEVSNAYASDLDTVARVPFVAHVNACIASVQGLQASLMRELQDTRKANACGLDTVARKADPSLVDSSPSDLED